MPKSEGFFVGCIEAMFSKRNVRSARFSRSMIFAHFCTDIKSKLFHKIYIKKLRSWCHCNIAEFINLPNFARIMSKIENSVISFVLLDLKNVAE